VHDLTFQEPFMHEALIDVELRKISTPPPQPIFTSIAFSNNGFYLLIGTSLDVHYVLDAFSLTLLRRLVGHRGLANPPGVRAIETHRGASGEEVGWTADSKWVVSGSSDGGVFMWDLSAPDGGEKLETRMEAAEQNRWPAQSLEPAVELRANELGVDGATGPSRAVKFSPRYCMMGVAGDNLVSVAVVLGCSSLILAVVLDPGERAA
jgi:COMPASS component SWD2